MTIKPFQKFENFAQFCNYFKDDATCIEYFKQIRWGSKITCPECGHSTYAFADGKRFKCTNKACRKNFTYKTGKLSLRKEFCAIFLIMNRSDISPIELAQAIGVTRNTAQLILLHFDNFIPKLEEQPTIDEHITVSHRTVIQSTNKRRHSKLSSNERSKKYFFGIVQRNGSNIVMQQLSNDNADALKDTLQKYIAPNAIISTDEWDHEKARQKFEKARQSVIDKMPPDQKWRYHAFFRFPKKPAGTNRPL